MTCVDKHNTNTNAKQLSIAKVISDKPPLSALFETFTLAGPLRAEAFAFSMAVFNESLIAEFALKGKGTAIFIVHMTA